MRLGLAAVAVLQIVVAAAALGPGIHGASSHVGHEMASWDLALAVGFLLAAWRPSAAPPLVPLVAALVVGLAATGAIDLSSGRISASGETGHGIDVFGLVLLCAAAYGPPRMRRGRSTDGFHVADIRAGG